MIDEEIRAYIDSRLADERQKRSEDVGANRVFSPVLSKWFRDEKGSSYGCLMRKALKLSAVDSYGIWEHVRPIVTKMCGTSYVTNIKDPDKANRYAEAICQCIYDLLTEEGEHE